MNFRAFCLLSLCALTSGCALVGMGGGDYLVRGEVGLIRLAPSGDLALEDGSGITSNNSIATLGLDDKQTEPYVKAQLRFASNEFTLLGFQTGFSGTGTATANFGNITSGATVNSDLDIKNLKFSYRWYLVDTDLVSVGPGIGVDYMDVDATIEAPALAITEDFSAKAPIPVPGIGAEVRLGPVDGYADLCGISAHVGDLDGTFYDFEGGLKFKPFPHVDALVGYRVIHFEASGQDGNQDFNVDYKLPGFFFSLGIRF